MDLNQISHIFYARMRYISSFRPFGETDCDILPSIHADILVAIVCARIMNNDPGIHALKEYLNDFVALNLGGDDLSYEKFSRERSLFFSKFLLNGQRDFEHIFECIKYLDSLWEIEGLQNCDIDYCEQFFLYNLVSGGKDSIPMIASRIRFMAKEMPLIELLNTYLELSKIPNPEWERTFCDAFYKDITRRKSELTSPLTAGILHLYVYYFVLLEDQTIDAMLSFIV